MQIWQHWMERGNAAYAQHQWTDALHCYQHALDDVWPVWLQSTLGPAASNGTLAQLSADELCLPTCCFVVTVRNLACCYRAANQPGRGRALLKQTQRWLCCALQQPQLPATLCAALLCQQADVQEELQRCWPHTTPADVTITFRPAGACLH